MIDYTRYDIAWRGYPLRYISEAVDDALAALPVEVGRGVIWKLLADAQDTAQGPDETSGWLFESTVMDVTVWIERAGGARDERGHHGGFWTMYLPEER